MDSMETTPVFVFTGFMESGKTTMIKRWLTQDFFREQDRTVLIVCEDGFTEFEEDKLDPNTTLVTVEKKDDFTSRLLDEIEKKYSPTAIIIEHNCMARLDQTLDIAWPENWDLVEISAMIDAQTFESQMKNMRPIMMEQFSYASVVVFNRCDENTNRLLYRSAVKAVNPQASVMFMDKNGQMIDSADLLPFDINADVIEIEDVDYGLWFVDVFENCTRYENKTVKFKGRVERPKGYPANSFLAGRDAMTCCADDVAYLKLLCVCQNAVSLKKNDWVTVTANIKLHQPEGDDAPSPVFYVTEISKARKPETELVYFS
ncbi:MAG: GTP-binding protein [Oscillospiraceae bacterium]|nr:GTP-binding protein [Oscillospiraceae bacterium]